MGQMVFLNAKKYGKRIVLKYKNNVSGNWDDISWNKLAEQVKLAAKALIEIGVKEKDKVAIFSQNMHEIITVDLALQNIKATAVPMYATSSVSQIEYIVNDAEIGVLFVGEQYQYDKAVEVMKTSKFLKRIIAIDPSVDLRGVDSSISYANFLLHGEESESADTELADRQARMDGDDLATLIYTSGTTGEPKGVMLYNHNYVQAMKIHDERLVNVSDKDVSLCFLPLSHVFERAWTYYCLHKGMTIYVNHNPADIQKTLKEVRPTAMCAVPRFWEKVYAGVNDKIDSFSPFLQKLAHRAIAVGKRYNIDYKANNLEAPAMLKLQYKFWSATLFKILKKAIGIENGNIFPCAGSQVVDEMNIFLHSVGINLVAGYGLTESTATVSCFNPHNRDYTVQSVGDIMPEVEVKIGENDEILLRGKTITSGYYNKPEANKEAFIDGWFRTGDAGRIDEKGRLYITERIKELFKTSNGKYIAPQQIENKLVVDKYIDQVATIGDQRKFVSALIVPAYDSLREYAQNAKIKFDSLKDLLSNDKIIKFYEGRIKALQSDLAGYEQVKKITLLKAPFTIDSGELTPTLKLKRKVINEHYAKEIEEMYS